MSNSIRDFVFRGLLFESEAEVFRKAGIRVGADLGQSEELLLLEDLSAYGVNRRNAALEMARLYAVLHAFENEVRSLIRKTLEEKVGSDWWENLVPKKIKAVAESRQQAAEKDSWIEGAKGDKLEFVDFGGLSSIIITNWDNFREILSSKEWVQQRMNELEKARNFVAHNRMLQPSEFHRIRLYISDWNKVRTYISNLNKVIGLNST